MFTIWNLNINKHEMELVGNITVSSVYSYILIDTAKKEKTWNSYFNPNKFFSIIATSLLLFGRELRSNVHNTTLSKQSDQFVVVNQHQFLVFDVFSYLIEDY